MRLWKKTSSHHASTSVIDYGCEAEGRLTFVGTVAINGKFQGDLLTADTLLLGETGEVAAEVRVGVAIISGRVKGNIAARERVELAARARVFGNIVTPVLVMQEGVIFEGQCKTNGEEVLQHE